jgi:hypothetical protein
VGKAAGAVVAGCSGPLTDVAWAQTGGPPVSVMANRTQAIGFEPLQAGTYEFHVSFTDAHGTVRTGNVAITAAGLASPSSVVARVDQAVRQGGGVSVRAWPTLAVGDSIQSIAWAQFEDPPVSLDTSDPARILFTAPDVERDTLLRFRVTLRTNHGTTDHDDALVLVEKYDQAPATGAFAWEGYHVSWVHPYRPRGRGPRSLPPACSTPACRSRAPPGTRVLSRRCRSSTRRPVASCLLSTR